MVLSASGSALEPSRYSECFWLGLALLIPRLPSPERTRRWLLLVGVVTGGAVGGGGPLSATLIDGLGSLPGFLRLIGNWPGAGPWFGVKKKPPA